MTCRECGGITFHNPAGCLTGNEQARKALAFLVASPLPIPRLSPTGLLDPHVGEHEYREDMRAATLQVDRTTERVAMTADGIQIGEPFRRPIQW